MKSPVTGRIIKHCKLFFSILLIGLAQSVFAQNDSTANEDREWNIRPSVSLGAGMLNYKGDILASSSTFNPFQNKLALHFNASQPINEYLDLNFFMMFGRVGANERTLVRNLNFESRITTGGLGLSYNFDHLLKEDRYLEPFVSVGFEAFEFISKTDRFDSYGNPYYFWSDGTLRNMPEANENVGEAIEITRDYLYETDVRRLNQDGFGNYSQRSFAIPFGGGFNLLMNDKMTFTMGFEYHWTFTDYIDGITENSRGIRAGNKKSDKFMHTFMRLTYDLTPVPHIPEPDNRGEDNMDSDLDSIPDFADLCPNTPLGLEVDAKGCPLDTDVDGVFDYVDDEINSPEGSIVDSLGVAMSDAALEQMYLEYIDETGKYAAYTNESYSKETAERKTKRRRTSYSVKIGEFEEGINDSLANVLLSMSDVSTRITEDGKTIIEVGNIDNLPDAIKKRIQLEGAGIATQDVIENNASGNTSKVTNIEQNAASNAAFGMSVNEAIEKNRSLPAPKRLILSENEYTLDRPIDSRSVASVDDSQFGAKAVYRVQIGAFANKLSADKFEGINDLIVITTQDGLTRYYTGSFTSYKEAASRKIDMVQRGFDGAYVVPFKGGQKATLKSSGVTPASNVVPLPSKTSSNDGKVKFLIQIGAYKNQIPAEVLDRMMDLGRIEQDKGSDGTVKYFTGNFNSYEEAKNMKAQLISSGFDGAFVTAKFNGNYISANEGIELLK
jgi:cell division protein FtsN